MDRQHTLDLLDHLDDALHHLQQAVIASADPQLLGPTDKVMALQDEYEIVQGRTADQLTLDGSCEPRPGGLAPARWSTTYSSTNTTTRSATAVPTPRPPPDTMPPSTCSPPAIGSLTLLRCASTGLPVPTPEPVLDEPCAGLVALGPAAQPSSFVVWPVATP